MEIIIVVAINLLTQVLKKFIFPKWGKFGVQAFVFLLALVGTGVYSLYASNVEFQALVAKALQLLTGAIALYELILKRLPIFTPVTPEAPKESEE